MPSGNHSFGFIFTFRKWKTRETHPLDDKSPLLVLKLLSIGLLDSKQTSTSSFRATFALNFAYFVLVFFLPRLVCFLTSSQKSKHAFSSQTEEKRNRLDSGCRYLEEGDGDVDVLRDGPDHHPSVRVLDPGLPTVQLRDKRPSETPRRARALVCVRASHLCVGLRLLPWSTCAGSSGSTPPSACPAACGSRPTPFQEQQKKKKR